jgi:catechol 2,3-dioxygenase-like lactoylglutathione lyase family enzyme
MGACAVVGAVAGGYTHAMTTQSGSGQAFSPTARAVHVHDAPTPGVAWSVGLSLDVQDLERSCEFYGRLLGFVVVDTYRAGMLLERRTLRSGLLPSVQLTLRGAFGKRVTGSQPGSVLSMDLAVSDWPAGAVALGERLAGGAVWVGKAPGPDDASGQLLDPDGYVVQLWRVG